jgi:stage III sporulation protein SpoIIIAA
MKKATMTLINVPYYIFKLQLKTILYKAFVCGCGEPNFLMIGSPGSGKTMLARKIPTILI